LAGKIQVSQMECCVNYDYSLHFQIYETTLGRWHFGFDGCMRNILCFRHGYNRITLPGGDKPLPYNNENLKCIWQENSNLPSEVSDIGGRKKLSKYLLTQ